MTSFESKNTPVTYLVWVLLWVNAIKDSYLWMDSPDCFFFKNDFIQWNHDITSKLRQADGNHKILSTISDADSVIWNRSNRFVQTLKTMAEKPFVKQIFVSSMPMSQVIWTDYDGIIKQVKSELSEDKPIFNIPSRSMTDCWLEWYADLLFSLAKNIDITWGNQRKENVAIIWNLFDRGELDCIANVKELTSIMEALGLNVVSVWLEGSNYEDILKIKDAGTIISLPYWRKAAKKISLRLNAWLLELDLPFGIDSTVRFIRSIWWYFERESLAEDFITHNLQIVNSIDILKWVIPHTFFWKKVAFYGDPYLLNGLIDLSKTFWFKLEHIFIHWEEKHLVNNKQIDTFWLNIKYWLWPSDILDDIDILIFNSHHQLWRNSLYRKMMQFWFPSYDYHVYTYEPYFWFTWTLKFLNRMANVINS